MSAHPHTADAYDATAPVTQADYLPGHLLEIEYALTEQSIEDLNRWRRTLVGSHTCESRRLLAMVDAELSRRAVLP